MTLYSLFIECRHSKPNILHPIQNQNQVYVYNKFYQCSMEAKDVMSIEGLHENNIITNFVNLNKRRFFQIMFATNFDEQVSKWIKTVIYFFKVESSKTTTNWILASSKIHNSNTFLSSLLKKVLTSLLIKLMLLPDQKLRYRKRN